MQGIPSSQQGGRECFASGLWTDICSVLSSYSHPLNEIANTINLTFQYQKGFAAQLGSLFILDTKDTWLTQCLLQSRCLVNIYDEQP